MGFVWTPSAVHRLQELAQSGAIVKEIAEDLGVTRNAIIGKASRIGVRLSPNRGPKTGGHIIPQRQLKSPVINLKRRKPPRAVEMAPEPDALNIPFDDLRRNHCRFPVTADSPFLFCGQPKTHGSSYCAHHHARCHEADR